MMKPFSQWDAFMLLREHVCASFSYPFPGESFLISRTLKHTIPLIFVLCPYPQRHRVLHSQTCWQTRSAGNVNFYYTLLCHRVNFLTLRIEIDHSGKEKWKNGEHDNEKTQSVKVNSNAVSVYLMMVTFE